LLFFSQFFYETHDKRLDLLSECMEALSLNNPDLS